MKKIITLLFILATLVLTACGNNPPPQNAPANQAAGSANESHPAPHTITGADGSQFLSAFERYLNALDIINAAKSLRIHTVMESIVKMDGQAVEMEMISTIDQVINSPTDVNMRIEALTRIDNEEIPMSAYFRGTTLYLMGDTPGQGYKMQLSLQDAIEMANVDILIFNANSIVDQVVFATPYGTGLAFTLDSSMMVDVVNNMSEGLFYLLGGFFDGLNMEIGDISAVIILNESDEIKSIEVGMSIDVDTEGMTINMQSTTFTEISQLGSTTINFPDYLHNFVEF